MTATPDEPNTAAAVPGPGARLAQARRDLHLTHEEVAAKLHLASRQIQALEEDDYSVLPGPTYVRGYLKSYALLLGLAPEPVLEAHARSIARPAAPDYSTIARQKEITSEHHQVRFVTYVVIVIVIGLAFAWWQGREPNAPHPLLAPPQAEAPANGAPVAPGTETEAKLADAAPVVAATPAAPTAATPAAPAAPVAATVAPAPAVAPQAASAPPLPAGPRVKLVLTADQDSWADIRDARQMKLLYETVPAGRTVTLEGVAPLSVFLGNAAGVRLDYNGRAVDVARHKRGMMARFTLGEEEASVTPATP
jgi:cytoskeleton protein RodZ